MSERWLPVVGWEGIYSVSDLGNVRRDAPGPNARVGENRRAVRDPHGYYAVQLTHRGRIETAKVHRLVARAFLGPSPFDGAEVNHRDGVKAHNALANLEWCTRVENIRHARDTGLRPPLRGERHGRAKLTSAQVKEIRSATGVTQRDIAAKYGVGRTIIGEIRRGEAWTHG